jgi:hypothetical protein
MKAKIRALLNQRMQNLQNSPEPCCSVCRLPESERSALDSALTNRRLSLGVLARRFGPSKAALWRHFKSHVVSKQTKQPDSTIRPVLGDSLNA